MASSTTSWSWSTDPRSSVASTRVQSQLRTWYGSAPIYSAASRRCTGWGLCIATSSRAMCFCCPMGRWSDAAAFREALQATHGPHVARLVAAIVGGVAFVVAALVVGKKLLGSPEPTHANPGAPQVLFSEVEYVGPSDRRTIADSLVRLVRSDLGPHITFDSGAQALVVRARMTVTGGDVTLHLSGGIPASEFHVTIEHWSALRDSIGYKIVLRVWADRSPLAPTLPPSALPRTWNGLIRFLEAEQIVAQAEWKKADSAYQAAEANDTTCWIC